jgi:hypothetical protein
MAVMAPMTARSSITSAAARVIQAREDPQQAPAAGDRRPGDRRQRQHGRHTGPYRVPEMGRQARRHDFCQVTKLGHQDDRETGRRHPPEPGPAAAGADVLAVLAPAAAEAPTANSTATTPLTARRGGGNAVRRGGGNAARRRRTR